jgi:predicted secreted acid phosphatase
MYGTWENAIYNYRHPSEAEKAQMRVNALELP